MMRQGNQNKRVRGRNRKGPSPLTRSYESNGPDVKIRGTALHIAEKYAQLSRDAHSSGDRIMAENYLQHAEHYYRIVAAAQQSQQRDEPSREGRFEDSRYNGERQLIGGDRHADADGGQEDEDQPRINGHHAHTNGAGRPGANGSRHIADAEQPSIEPPEHFERGGVENVNQDTAAPRQDSAAAASEGGDGEAAGTAAPRRRRAPRAPRTRTPRAAKADAEAGSAPSASSESEPTPGDA